MTLEEFLNDWNSPSGQLLVHTSGSTGKPKPLWVEKRRMEASARITCNFLGLHEGDSALLCMPLDFIAGKMMVVRALTCGLRLLSITPTSHPMRELSEVPVFAAMVPMQVYSSLQVPDERERLRAIRHLIIGGGAIDEALAAELKDFPNAVWSTYGMTETLSHIALRRLNGPAATDWYTPFEGVGVSLNEESCLVIDAPAVHEGTLVTNDIAELLPVRPEGPADDATTAARDGRKTGATLFRILGRKDNVVCSGGIKLQIETLEAKLRQHIAAPFMLTKCRDERLGEALVLLTEQADAESLRPLCQQVLGRYEVPRHYLHVAKVPLTPTGKPARRDAFLLASNLLP